MALTPEAVVEKRFQATKFREGYDQDEVDDFLDEVVAELRRLHAENDELRSKLKTCELRVGELSRAGATSPQVVVQKVAEPAPAPAPEPKPEPAPAPAPTPAFAPAAADQGSAASMLSLAQEVHDKHVQEGEKKRDELVSEAKAQAERLISDAENKQRETLGSLERERSMLEREIEKLRVFERDYRSRLKSYLESQLRELETKGAIIPGRSTSGSSNEAGFATYGGSN